MDNPVAVEWRERVRASMVGEFVPVEQWCLPYPNRVSPIGVHCGGLPTALGHLRNYADAVAHMAEGDRVLNIGGGSGLSSRLFFLVTGEEVVHTDRDVEYVELSDVVYPCPGVTRICWDITEPAPEGIGLFDIVVCTEVLEHIEFDLWPDVRENVKALLKPYGKFITSFPVNEDLFSGNASSYHLVSIPSADFVVEFFEFDASIEFVLLGDARGGDIQSTLDWWLDCFTNDDKRVIAERLRSYLCE